MWRGKCIYNSMRNVSYISLRWSLRIVLADVKPVCRDCTWFSTNLLEPTRRSQRRLERPLFQARRLGACPRYRSHLITSSVIPTSRTSRVYDVHDSPSPTLPHHASVATFRTLVPSTFSLPSPVCANLDERTIVGTVGYSLRWWCSRRSMRAPATSLCQRPCCIALSRQYEDVWVAPTYISYSNQTAVPASVQRVTWWTIFRRLRSYERLITTYVKYLERERWLVGEGYDRATRRTFH